MYPCTLLSLVNMGVSIYSKHNSFYMSIISKKNLIFNHIQNDVTQAKKSFVQNDNSAF